MGVSCGSKNPPDFPCMKRFPWCAPGTAPVKTPCGFFGGGYEQEGRDMRDLSAMPVALQDTWTTGTTAEVGFSITANHGGGYSYRLCPADSDLSEECFQAHTLSFTGNLSKVVDESGKTLAIVPAMRTTAESMVHDAHE